MDPNVEVRTDNSFFFYLETLTEPPLYNSGNKDYHGHITLIRYNLADADTDSTFRFRGKCLQNRYNYGKANTSYVFCSYFIKRDKLKTSLENGRS